MYKANAGITAKNKEHTAIMNYRHPEHLVDIVSIVTIEIYT